ncbi:MAG: flagellar assembly protein FliH [Candidatus Eremiobacteraeota bacterium]|nr:flagellar assembly protein FliH [Candidatus Eremiobacteraeota bacterium]
MQAPENFKSLAALLRPPPCERVDEGTIPDDAAPTQELRSEPSQERAACDDIRLFRARVAEALECALDGLYRDLASEVFARELMLRPVDVRAVCNAVIERYAREVPVAVRAHPDDCSVLDGFDVPVISDQRLRLGDVILQVANGSLDASLGVRLEHILRRRQT